VIIPILKTAKSWNSELKTPSFFFSFLEEGETKVKLLSGRNPIYLQRPTKKSFGGLYFIAAGVDVCVRVAAGSDASVS
jgi:hypothetical protein